MNFSAIMCCRATTRANSVNWDILNSKIKVEREVALVVDIFKPHPKNGSFWGTILFKLFAFQNSQIQNASNLFLFDCSKTGVFSNTKGQIGVTLNECLGVI